MKEQYTGPGCLTIVGFGCAVLAGVFLIGGIIQPDSGPWFPFVGAAIAAVLCFGVSDVQSRLTRIERQLRLGEDSSPKRTDHEKDSNTEIAATE